jgi:hypothetical protein
MMLLSLSTPSIFQNFSGVLDGLGNATATLNLPNLPALSGFQFKMAAVSLEAVSSSGVKSITDPLNFQIL